MPQVQGSIIKRNSNADEILSVPKPICRDFPHLQCYALSVLFYPVIGAFHQQPAMALWNYFKVLGRCGLSLPRDKENIYSTHAITLCACHH